MQNLFYQSGSIKLPKKAHMQVPFMGKGLYSGTFFPLFQVDETVSRFRRSHDTMKQMFVLVSARSESFEAEGK